MPNLGSKSRQCTSLKGVEKQLNLNHFHSGSFQVKSRNIYLSALCLFAIVSPLLQHWGFSSVIFLRDTFQCILPVTQLLSTLVNVFSYGYISGLGAQVSAPYRIILQYILYITSGPVFKLALFLFSALPQKYCGMGRNHFPTFTIHLFTAILGPASSVISCGVSHPPAFFPTLTHI